jgi:hypothetical protein
MIEKVVDVVGGCSGIIGESVRVFLEEGGAMLLLYPLRKGTGELCFTLSPIKE